MGWAERLNPNSKRNRRERARLAAIAHVERVQEIARKTLFWLYGYEVEG